METNNKSSNQTRKFCCIFYESEFEAHNSNHPQDTSSLSSNFLKIPQPSPDFFHYLDQFQSTTVDSTLTNLACTTFQQPNKWIFDDDPVKRALPETKRISEMILLRGNWTLPSYALRLQKGIPQDSFLDGSLQVAACTKSEINFRSRRATGCPNCPRWIFQCEVQKIGLNFSALLRLYSSHRVRLEILA